MGALPSDMFRSVGTPLRIIYMGYILRGPDNDYEPVPYSVGVVSEEAGEKLWVPDIPVGQKPAYGQQYKSKKNKDDNVDLKYFAAFRLKYVEGRGYWCYEFIEGHNHSLVNEEDGVFLVSSRDVSYTQQVFLYQASQVNLGPVKGFNLLRVIYGEYDFIGVGPDLAKDETFKRRISDIVWTDRIEPEEFEDLWERFMVGCQKFAQRKNDHDSRYAIPDFHTELQIGKEASELYTRSIFFDVQTEIYASMISCMSVSVSDVDSGKKYVIQDTGEDEKISRRHRIVKGKPLHDVFYEVLCKPSEEFYQCTCKRFESYGLLCRHIFYVIRLSTVKTFPRKYVLRRWSQDSLPPASVIQASGDTPDMILREIFRSVEYCVNRYANEPELLQKFRNHQVQLMAKADADVPIPKKTNKRDRIASILGVSQPEEIVVNIPKQKFRNHQVQLMAKADADVPIPKKTNKRDRIASILGVSQPEEIVVNIPKQAKCNAVRAQIAAKKASDKAAVREMKQKERLAAKKARMAEKNASVLAAKKARMAEKNACVVS
ncbi:FAR1 DNA binding domain, Zinc finger, SWIM-type, MULE transposase domain, FHY3/FAR1 family [Artemisia annua]|uniref:FAR1 DNA binding domain, Zinc finger, SWIM-type, MULE transposase domain, FHY3/FAR1 family n=1 Tax=Artemisia annua TaxID=35608 RepID=A0A2U1NM37_ARTAN|nr:FAR1 DNA binding domain, Zinc finger, SWIM-type, MULE transposase domain, FHY3/FAR1 family [Artemisia annua]